MNTTQTQHTPTPWASIVPPSSCLTTRFIEGPNGEHVAKIGHMGYSSGDLYSDLANAAHIVHCVNSHAALVAENKRLRDALEDCNGVLDSINRQLGGKSVAVRAVLDKARAALAKEDV